MNSNEENYIGLIIAGIILFILVCLASALWWIILPLGILYFLSNSKN